MKSLCKSFNTLERMAFGYDPKLVEAALDGIEEGLYETTQWKRKQFTISVLTQHDDAESAKQLILKITRIIHWFERPQIENWMFLWHIKGFQCEKFDKEMILKQWRDISSNKHKIDMDRYGFCISNKNCKINGYQR